MEIRPGEPVAAAALQKVFIAKGMRDEHLALQRRLIARDPELVAALELGLAENGYEGAMHATADLQAARYEGSSGPARGFIIPTFIARWYLLAGDHDRAMEWLEKAFEVGDPNLPRTGFPAIWDPMRSDPRFQDLLRRMNLPMTPAAGTP